MAFYIQTSDPSKSNGSVTTYGLPSKSGVDANTVTSVSADGHELAMILTKFRNLPVLTVDHNMPDGTARGYMMTWFGDHAKFIVANL
jgi:hypothetical protein